jgi:hypothetical protein
MMKSNSSHLPGDSQLTRVRFDGEGSGKERFMRTILWTIGVIVGVVMLFAGFTKAAT